VKSKTMIQEQEKKMRQAYVDTEAALNLIDATKQSKRLMDREEPPHEFDEVEYCRAAKAGGSVAWAY
jgi:hypothetical protein